MKKEKPVLGGQDLREHIIMETMPDGMEEALVETAQSILRQNIMELAQIEVTRMLLDARVISIKSDQSDFDRALASARKRVKGLQQIVEELLSKSEKRKRKNARIMAALLDKDSAAQNNEEKKSILPTILTAPFGAASIIHNNEDKPEAREEDND